MEKAVLTITRHEDGQVEVQGPISEQVLCYGLLEVARDAVKQFNDDRAKLVRPAAPADMAAISPARRIG